MATETSAAALETVLPTSEVRAKTPPRRVVVAYVRKLQRHANHEPCFMTEARYACMELGCRWRADCMRLVADYFR